MASDNLPDFSSPQFQESDTRTVRSQDEPLLSRNIGKMPFSRAAKSWLETRRAYISPRTFRDYQQYIVALGRHFLESRLVEIGGDDIRSYQRARNATAGAARINQECGILQQMLKRIGRWPVIAQDYQSLPEKKHSIGRALSDDERARLFSTAASKPQWEMAYLFAAISVNTTVGPKEAWTLRLRDVDLIQRFIRVQPEGAKTFIGCERFP